MNFHITSEELSQLLQQTKKVLPSSKELSQLLERSKKDLPSSKLPSSEQLSQLLENTKNYLRPYEELAQKFLTDSSNFYKISETIKKSKELTKADFPFSTKNNSDNVCKENKETEQELSHHTHKLGKLQKEILLKLLKYSNNKSVLVVWNSTKWFSKNNRVLRSAERSKLHKTLTSLVKRKLIIREKRKKRKEYVQFTELGLRLTQKYKHLWELQK
ncbi:hypothetical protein [Scytonema sp. PCC 10023]|uniref:hypothetical protein n=1 Tax=Scytonema sp. PCC 10023 TaxID=1680591 RepID=UPI0039C5DC7D